MDDNYEINWKDRRRELRFPSLERITIEEALGWMDASLTFFEKACRSQDLARLMACGKIAYALHNLPEVVVKRLRDEPVSIFVYGPGFAMEGPPEVTRYCGAFFSLPTHVQMPALEISADDPLFQELRSLYLLFRFWNIGHAQTSYDEALDTLKRPDLSEVIHLCRKRVKAMRSHFDLWLEGEPFDHDSFRQEVGEVSP
jgi:hypothetical protein